jgi:hypothetical protein
MTIERMSRSIATMSAVQGAGSSEPLFDDFPLGGELLPNQGH